MSESKIFYYEECIKIYKKNISEIKQIIKNKNLSKNDYDLYLGLISEFNNKILKYEESIRKLSEKKPLGANKKIKKRRKSKNNLNSLINVNLEKFNFNGRS